MRFYNLHPCTSLACRTTILPMPSSGTACCSKARVFRALATAWDSRSASHHQKRTAHQQEHQRPLNWFRSCTFNSNSAAGRWAMVGRDGKALRHPPCGSVARASEVRIRAPFTPCSPRTLTSPLRALRKHRLDNAACQAGWRGQLSETWYPGSVRYRARYVVT